MHVKQYGERKSCMNGEERTVDLDVDDNACLFQLLVGRKVSKGLKNFIFVPYFKS